jgi:hypothetical protein
MKNIKIILLIFFIFSIVFSSFAMMGIVIFNI